MRCLIAIQSMHIRKIHGTSRISIIRKEGYVIISPIIIASKFCIYYLQFIASFEKYCMVCRPTSYKKLKNLRRHYGYMVGALIWIFIFVFFLLLIEYRWLDIECIDGNICNVCISGKAQNLYLSLRNLIKIKLKL